MFADNTAENGGTTVISTRLYEFQVTANKKKTTRGFSGRRAAYKAKPADHLSLLAAGLVCPPHPPRAHPLPRTIDISWSWRPIIFFSFYDDEI